MNERVVEVRGLRKIYKVHDTFIGMLVGTVVAVIAASWFRRVGPQNYTGASA